MIPLRFNTPSDRFLPRSLLVAAAAAACAGAASAQTAYLDVKLTNGATTAVVAPGQGFQILLSVRSTLPVDFNAAQLRLISTEEGMQLDNYEWSPPFVTRSKFDYSLNGAALPLVVNDSTLQGPGYPINTSDVEFGNFLMTGSAQPGEYARVSLRVPQETPVGTEFFLVASADSFTDGFDTLAVATGAVLRVNVVAGSGTPIIGDLDGDTRVSGADLALLLGMWGSPNPAGDLDGDGTVGGPDLGLLLSNWS